MSKPRFSPGTTVDLPAIDRQRSVDSIPDSELLRRAVIGARARTPKSRKHYRWVGVMEVFCMGSGFAMDLCRRFDLDPDELVKR